MSTIAGFTLVQQRPFAADTMARLHLVRDESGRDGLLTIGNHPVPGVHWRTYRWWAESVQRISAHRHIADVLSVGTTPEGLGYLVTATGAAILSDSLHRCGPYAVGEALGFGIDLADALADMHAAGLVHGALRPSTIQIDSGGSALLAGLNTLMPAMSLPIRADAYTAPEFLSTAEAGGIAASPAADVYALAITLWVALGGLLPWATDPAEPNRRTAHMPVIADVPQQVLMWLGAAAHPRPAMRPAAAALRDAIAVHSAAVRRPDVARQPRLPAAANADTDFELSLFEGAGIRPIGKRRIPAGASVDTQVAFGRDKGLVGVLSPATRATLTAAPAPEKAPGERSERSLRETLMREVAVPSTVNLSMTFVAIRLLDSKNGSALWMAAVFFALLTVLIALQRALERRGHRPPSVRKLVVGGSAGYSIAVTSTAMVFTGLPTAWGVVILVATIVIAAASFTFGLVVPQLLGTARDHLVHQVATAFVAVAVSIPAVIVGEGVTHPAGELEGAWRWDAIRYIEKTNLKVDDIGKGMLLLVRESGCLGPRCPHIGDGDEFDTRRFVRQTDGSYAARYILPANCVETFTDRMIVKDGYSQDTVATLRPGGYNPQGQRLLEIKISSIGTPTSEAAKQKCPPNSAKAEGTATEV